MKEMLLCLAKSTAELLGSRSSRAWACPAVQIGPASTNTGVSLSAAVAAGSNHFA